MSSSFMSIILLLYGTVHPEQSGGFKFLLEFISPRVARYIIEALR